MYIFYLEKFITNKKLKINAFKIILYQNSKSITNNIKI